MTYTSQSNDRRPPPSARTRSRLSSRQSLQPSLMQSLTFCPPESIPRSLTAAAPSAACNLPSVRRCSRRDVEWRVNESRQNSEDARESGRCADTNPYFAFGPGVDLVVRSGSQHSRRLVLGPQLSAHCLSKGRTVREHTLNFCPNVWLPLSVHCHHNILSSRLRGNPAAISRPVRL